MGEKELNQRAGYGCSGCGINKRPTSTALPRGYHSAAARNSCGCANRQGPLRNTGCSCVTARNTRGGNERTAEGDLNCCEMKEQLRKLEFAIVDVALYLNAYPKSDCALAYYHKLIEERDCLLGKINDSCGPMTLYDNRSKSSWKWADGPWPWHMDSN